MTDDTTQTVPTDDQVEVTDQEVENTVEESQEETTEPTPEEKPQENLVTIPADRLMDYKRKINGSRDEAMRLKADKERLEAELAQTRSPQVQFSNQDVEQLRMLARQAGIPLKEDFERLQVNTYEQEKQQAVNEFLAKHPEYAQVGSAQSDELWNMLDDEVKLYVAPERGKDYLTIMEKANKNLNYNPAIEREKGKALGMAQARLQENSTIGGSGKGSAPRKASQTHSAVMEGFASVRPQAFNS